MRVTRHGQLAILTLAGAAALLGRTCVGPVQEAVKHALALSDDQIAVLQGAALALPALLCAIPVGWLVDHHSRTRLLLVVTSIGLAGALITGLGAGYWEMFLGRVCAGLAAYATPIVAISMIADLYEEAERGRANTVLAVGEVIGMSSAFALGGAVLARMGRGSTAWRGTLLVLAIPLVVALAALAGVREPPRLGAAAEAAFGGRHGIGKWWQALSRYRSLVSALAFGVGIVGVADGAALIWVAPMFARRFHDPAGQVGTLVGSALLISGLLGPFIGGLLADSCQRARGPRLTLRMLCGLALASAATSGFGVVPRPALAEMILIAFMTAGAAINVAATALISVVIPNDLRGSVSRCWSGAACSLAWEWRRSVSAGFRRRSAGRIRLEPPWQSCALRAVFSPQAHSLWDCGGTAHSRASCQLDRCSALSRAALLSISIGGLPEHDQGCARCLIVERCSNAGLAVPGRRLTRW